MIKNKKTMLRMTGLCVLTVLAMLITVSSAFSESEDTVFIDTPQAYISATPSTLHGSGYIYLEVESKQITTDVTMLFGYNGGYIKPKTFEYYNPRSVQETKSYTCPSFLNFNYTLTPKKYFWCYTDEGVVFEHSFESGDLQSRTATWTETVFKEWQIVPGVYGVINHEFDGKDTWRYVQNIPLQEGIRYVARAYIEAPSLPIGESNIEKYYPGYDPKYDIAFFSSSIYGTNIQQAINDNKFYYLDPEIDLTTGLVAYWDADGTTNLSNRVAGGTDLTISGTVPLQTGLHGDAYEFLDNTANQLRAASASEMPTGGSDRTICFWIEPDQKDGGDNDFWFTHGGTSTDAGFAWYVNTASKGSNAYYASAPAHTSSIPLNEWSHICIQYDGSRVYSWQNATLEVNESRSTNTITQEVVIGVGSLSAYGDTDGLIDEIGVWNRVLTFDEINTLFNDGAGMSYEEIEATGDTPANITDMTVTPLNGDSNGIGDNTSFTTANLETIEFTQINFTITDFDGITEDITMYYTAGGANACTTGNLQAEICYNGTSYIQFKNNTLTDTYDDTAQGAARGDSFTVTWVGNSTSRDYSIKIDEHYNPNIFKWYSSGFDFSQEKYQDGANQRIHQDNIIKVEVNTTNIDIDSIDQYKLDFRVETSTPPPIGALVAYACNSSYTTGDPSLLSSCSLIASKTTSALQDDGTKFRAIFTNNLLTTIQNIKYIVLISNENAANKYYSIKTYNATTPGWAQKWEYSTDIGSSWQTNNDGYESELNLNWFTDGANPSQFNYIIQSTDNNSITTNSSLYSFQWNIDPTQNYAPIISILTPEDDASIVNMTNVSWNVNEPNNDIQEVNVSLNNGTFLLIQQSITNETTSILFNASAYASGNYNLTVESCETETVSKLCSSDTIRVTIPSFEDLTPPIITNEQNHTITDFGVFFNWSTNENANSSVNYGTAITLGGLVGDSSINITHELNVSGLDAGTIYYWNATSCDENGNCNTTGPFNFTTTGNKTVIPSYSGNIFTYDLTDTSNRTFFLVTFVLLYILLIIFLYFGLGLYFVLVDIGLIIMSFILLFNGFNIVISVFFIMFNFALAFLYNDD